MVFHWYDCPAAIFVPSLGTTDVILRGVDALTNFTQQALQDSQKVISMLNRYKLERRVVIGCKVNVREKIFETVKPEIIPE